MFRRRNHRQGGGRTPITGILYHLFRRTGFEVVDIGARRGAMPQLRLLAPFSHYYACEPDREEARKVSERFKADSWRAVTIIPEAMSSTETGAILHVTKQAGLSSLLRPNPSIVRRYYKGDEFEIVSTIPVRTISLDHAADQYGFRDACFLKIDTQGSELDILRSGSMLLKKSVLGIYVEVEFHAFYTGQPLFSNVDSYLRSFEFSLFDLDRSLLRRSSYRDSLYSRRQIVWAHALYLKEPESILNIDDETARLRAARLLGIALAFEHYDLALELVSSGRPAALSLQNYGSQIRDAVEEFVKQETKATVKKIKSARSVRDPFAFSYKDRDRM